MLVVSLTFLFFWVFFIMLTILSQFDIAWRSKTFYKRFQLLPCVPPPFGDHPYDHLKLYFQVLMQRKSAFPLNILATFCSHILRAGTEMMGPVHCSLRILFCFSTIYISFNSLDMIIFGMLSSAKHFKKMLNWESGLKIWLFTPEHFHGAHKRQITTGVRLPAIDKIETNTFVNLYHIPGKSYSSPHYENIPILSRLWD